MTDHVTNSSDHTWCTCASGIGIDVMAQQPAQLWSYVCVCVVYLLRLWMYSMCVLFVVIRERTRVSNLLTGQILLSLDGRNAKSDGTYWWMLVLMCCRGIPHQRMQNR